MIYYNDDDFSYHRRNRKKLYKSKNGILFGVCQGISNYTAISVGLIRLLVIVSFILSGFAPIGIIYLILAIFLPTRY